MTAPPYEARYRNQEKDPKLVERCRYCLDTGFVVVALRDSERAVVSRKVDGKHVPLTMPTALERAQEAGTSEEGLRYEEMAPCPMCQTGYKIEFSSNGAWGVVGYWQGRDPVDLKALEEADAKRLPKPENARRMREMAATMGVIGKEIEP